MNTIARFAIRPDDSTTGKLILGKLFPNGQDKLKDGMIYEIVDIFGELVIREVGISSYGLRPSDKAKQYPSWYSDAGLIVSDGHHLLTQEEVNQINEGYKDGE